MFTLLSPFVFVKGQHSFSEFMFICVLFSVGLVMFYLGVTGEVLDAKRCYSYFHEKHI